MTLPADYAERVYAGILGKIIGVYLGRPFEGWSYERIMAELGEIRYYVNHRHDLPLRNHLLVVTDDDISGTFTFLRAMPDYGNSLQLKPAQIGQTWLNYIIEKRTTLWWGGLGNSTEHTAYLRLKSGIPAPHSGAISLNGKVVAEQIGAQIFIEGWGLIAPGDPALAADFARRAASVSHDGEAIYAAQVVASMVAQAFIESNINHLLDTALALISEKSLIHRLITDIREWNALEPFDWRAARTRLAARYGYDQYGGNCHIIPNHGLVILSLLYGGGNFGLSQSIVNSCGWDTDCNAANVGCILGVRNGLAAFKGEHDWRGPLGDRLYIPSADGGRAITDAVQETYNILEIARSLHGETPIRPKGGARFHFSFPGSVQGFCSQPYLSLENVPHPVQPQQRVLALHYRLEPGGATAALTPTFIPPEAIDMPGYELLASPTLYPGQTVSAELLADRSNELPVKAGIVIQSYGKDDELVTMHGPTKDLFPGQDVRLEWWVPDLGGEPIAGIGISIASEQAAQGAVYLDHMTWGGSPEAAFLRPSEPGRMWKRQWVDAVDGFSDQFEEAFRLVQNRGRGFAITGTREWTNYRLETKLTPHLVKAFGVAARFQGLQRYYALLLCERDTIQLIKHLDEETVLVEQRFDWEYGQSYDLRLIVNGNQVEAWINEIRLLMFEDLDQPLISGGIALICEEGRIGTDRVVVAPIERDIDA